MTVDWTDTQAPALEGTDRSIAWEGVAKHGISKGQAYGYFAEDADSYITVVIVGNDDDIEEARQVISVELLDEAPELDAAQAGTKDFISSMTAVLDSVNGANVLESFKALETTFLYFGGSDLTASKISILSDDNSNNCLLTSSIEMT